MAYRSMMLALLSALLSCSIANASELRIGVIDSDFQPYKWFDGQDFQGPMVDVVREAFGRAQVDLELLPMPYPRMVEEVRRGNRLDGAFGHFAHEELEPFVDYVSVPVGRGIGGIYIDYDRNLRIRNSEEWRGKLFGAIIGHHLPDNIQKAIDAKEAIVYRVATYDQLVNMLLLGRIDGIVSPSMAIESAKQDLGLNGAICLDMVLEERPLVFYFSKQAMNKQNIELSLRVKRAFDSMEKEGAIDAIYEKAFTRLNKQRLSVSYCPEHVTPASN